jgi:hypothetical protein
VQERQKILHRVNCPPEDIDTVLTLIEHLKGWRNRRVYLNGEKLPWDSVFSFVKCYCERMSDSDKDRYCFRDIDGWSINVFGCRKIGLGLSRITEWSVWGQDVGGGTWEYDKVKIRHVIEQQMQKYKLCPAFDWTQFETRFEKFPWRVEYAGDPKWRRWKWSHGVGVCPRNSQVVGEIAKQVTGLDFDMGPDVIHEHDGDDDRTGSIGYGGILKYGK